MEWMFLPLKRYASFDGRSRPQEFWMFFLLQLIIYIVLFVVTLVVAGGIAGLSSAGSDGGAAAASAGLMGMVAAFGIFFLVYGLVNLVFLVPNLAVAARRLHDTGRSGWWQLIYWVPLSLYIAFAVIGAGGQSPALTAVALVFSLLQLIGLIVLIVFYVMPGTPGPNQHGPDPLGRAPGLVPGLMAGYPPQPYQQPPRAY